MVVVRSSHTNPGLPRFTVPAQTTEYFQVRRCTLFEWKLVTRSQPTDLPPFPLGLRGLRQESDQCWLRTSLIRSLTGRLYIPTNVLRPGSFWHTDHHVFVRDTPSLTLGQNVVIRSSRLSSLDVPSDSSYDKRRQTTRNVGSSTRRLGNRVG